jgi:hypothetical protein
VIRQGENVIPIEVKFSHLKKTTLSRSFRNFIEKYQPETAYVINLSLEEKFRLAIRWSPSSNTGNLSNQL